MMVDRQRSRRPRLGLLLVVAAICWGSSAAAAGALEIAAEQPVLSGQAAASVSSKSHDDRGDGRSVYIVRLRDPAVAAYGGGIGDLAPTSPLTTGRIHLDAFSRDSVRYRTYLEGAQTALVQHCERAFARQIEVAHTYRYVFNGIAMRLTAAEAEDMRGLDDVVSVTRERFEVPLTDAGPAWIGAPALWSHGHYGRDYRWWIDDDHDGRRRVDGDNRDGHRDDHSGRREDGKRRVTGVQDDRDGRHAGKRRGYRERYRDGAKGEGVVVAVLDTGLNSDHPSFADIGGDGYDHDNPLGSGTYVPGSYCDTVDPGFCNDKLIGAWDMVQTPATDPGAPEDSDGHGSHTASIAVGNVIKAAIVEAPTDSLVRDISGVAPHANLIVYDVCIETCPGSAILAALEQVVIDSAALPNGIAALNYSISGGSEPYNDIVELGFLNATAAGIFVAASAGNEGPGAGTTGHNSPWVSATAAVSHNRALLATLTVDGLGVLDGATFSAGYGPATVVHASDYPTSNGSTNDTDPGQCLEPFPAGTWVDGEIVVCDRGTISRVDKGSNVLAGGAGGFVLANLDADGEDVVADPHFLPAVHIGDAAGDVLRAFLAANTGVVATLSGTILDLSNSHGDVTAGFSSRGPNTAIDVLKPDVAAPGVNIIAAVDDGGAPNPPEFGFNSGTSMASPHQAGAAALVSQLLPDLTPYEIKSLLMMTAKRARGLLKEDALTPADPFDAGAGRIDLEQLKNAGLALDEDPVDFLLADPALGGDPKTLNIASMMDSRCLIACSFTRSVTNRSDRFGGWTAVVRDVNGIGMDVSPRHLYLHPGESAEIRVTADTRLGTPGWSFTDLKLQPDDAARPTLHMPIALQAVASTDAALLTKTVSAASAREGDVLDYEIRVANGPLTGVIDVVDEVPDGFTLVPGSAVSNVVNGSGVLTTSGNRVAWRGTLDRGGLTVAESPAPFGYVSLNEIGVSPFPCPANCDDGGFVLTGFPEFEYNGETHTSVIWSVNGTIEVGTTSGTAASSTNQNLPDPSLPNNLLAPLWTDLNLGEGGKWYVALLTESGVSYIVFEWEDVPLFGDPDNRYTFQVWIEGGTDNISFVYADLGDVGGATVGVEDATGTHGFSYWYKGAGIAPAFGAELGLDVGRTGTAALNFSATIDDCPRADPVVVNRARLVSGETTADAVAVTACERSRRHRHEKKKRF